jgi:hypothetical protein
MGRHTALRDYASMAETRLGFQEEEPANFLVRPAIGRLIIRTGASTVPSLTRTGTLVMKHSLP